MQLRWTEYLFPKQVVTGSYPVILAHGDAIGDRLLRNQQTDGCRTGVQFPTSPPHLQVAKWEGVGLQNRLFVGSIPTLESNYCSVT